MVKLSCIGPATIVLDFDGVICDSAFEAFRLALFTRSLLSDPSDESLDDLYPSFLRWRSSVGPAWNYHFVLNEMIDNVWSSWELTEEAIDFQKAFFANRYKFLNNNRKQWLDMNPFYDTVLQVLQSTRQEIVILTNKNSQPVRDLLRYKGLFHFPVFSMDEMPHFECKSRFLNLFGSRRVKFLDDNVDIVRAANARTQDNVEAFLASWGYCAEENSLRNVEILNFGSWLDEN